VQGAERVAVGLLRVAVTAGQPTQDRQSRAAWSTSAGPCAASGTRYGAPRSHAELRQHGIRARRPRRYRVCTTDSKHCLPVAANVLEQNFVANQPNQVWLADITYIPTREGWLYLAVILDLFTRKVVGWAMREHMRAELTIAALTMAVQRQRPGAGLIHHSDRGSQYHNILQSAAITQSMSRKGNCWDNAPMESFFGTLKTELVHHREYPDRDSAPRDLFAYIEGYYNRRRFHSAIGYITPQQAEAKAAYNPVSTFPGESHSTGWVFIGQASRPIRPACDNGILFHADYRASAAKFCEMAEHALYPTIAAQYIQIALSIGSF
jgi:putative transposase